MGLLDSIAGQVMGVVDALSIDALSDQRRARAHPVPGQRALERGPARREPCVAQQIEANRSLNPRETAN